MLFEYVPEVEVLEIKPVTDSSNLRALVEVRVGNMKIDRFRLIQEPGKRANWWNGSGHRAWRSPTVSVKAGIRAKMMMFGLDSALGIW